MNSISFICSNALEGHNALEGNTYKYILPGVDVASKCKVVRALKTKKATEIAFALEAIYKKNGAFKYQTLSQCDNRSEFKSDATNFFEKDNIYI